MRPWRWNRHEGTGPSEGGDETRAHMPSLSLPCEATARRQPATNQEHSSDIQSAGTLTLDFPDSRTVRNKCWLFSTTQPLVLCLTRRMGDIHHHKRQEFSFLSFSKVKFTQFATHCHCLSISIFITLTVWQVAVPYGCRKGGGNQWMPREDPNQ